MKPKISGRDGTEELTHLLDEGEDRRPHHDVIDHLGLARDLREIFGKRRLGRRDCDMLQHFAALSLDRSGEVVAVVMTEGEIGKDHRDLLAEVLADKGCHRLDLAFHIGDARLQRVAIERARGDVMPFGDHEIRDFEFACGRRRADDHMAEEGAEGDVAAMLVREFLDDFGAPLGIGAVILGNDLNRPAIDAACVIDRFHGGLGGAPIPAAVGSTDAGGMLLKADPDRLRRLRLCIACGQR